MLALILVDIAARPAVVEGAPQYPVGKELLVGGLFVIAGLAGWTRRPDSRTGPLTTAAGLVWLLARVLVFASGSSTVFTVGLVLVVVPIALIAHMAVAFPTGRLSSTFELGVVISAYVVILAGVAFLDVAPASGSVVSVDADAALAMLRVRHEAVATTIRIRVNGLVSP